MRPIANKVARGICFSEAVDAYLQCFGKMPGSFVVAGALKYK